MRTKVALSILVIAAAGAMSPPSHGFGQKVVDRLCIADALKAAPFENGRPIPIGCELVDCCPGCPGAGAIEWRIQIGGAGITGAELTLEGLSGDEVSRVRVQGARPERNRLLLGRGLTRIQGLPFATRNRVGFAVVRPLVDVDLAGKQLDPAGDIIVQQFIDNSLINNYDWRIFIKPCDRVPVPPLRFEDRVKIDGLQVGEEAVVMLDARKASGCHDGSGGAASEWLLSSTGVTVVENLLFPAGCSSEIAVFSTNHFMHLETVTTWTNSPGDVHTITLQPLMDVNVHIWVPDDVTAAVAQQHITTAKDHYVSQRAGVRFVPTIRKLADVSTEPNPQQVVNAGVSSSGSACLDLASIQAKPYYTPKTLNVYYVNKAFRGRNCAIKATPPSCTLDASTYPPGDANMIFIGALAASTSLAHEIGHAYGLRPAACDGHTENVADIPSDNIMNALGADERRTLTLGQVFRMHTHADPWGGTMLIRNNVPWRTGRSCLPNAFGAACPALTVDWP